MTGRAVLGRSHRAVALPVGEGDAARGIYCCFSRVILLDECLIFLKECDVIRGVWCC